MRFAIFLMLIFIGAFTMWTPRSAAQEEIYRWVDENGVVHFGDRPPQHNEAEVISMPKSPDIRSEHSSDAEAVNPADAQDPQPSAAQQARDARAEARRELEAKAEASAGYCNTARNVVSQLEPSPRVNVTHEDGTVTRMDDDERLQKLAEANAFIAEHCNN